MAERFRRASLSCTNILSRESVKKSLIIPTRVTAIPTQYVPFYLLCAHCTLCKYCSYTFMSK